jgi:hypothetical protein
MSCGFICELITKQRMQATLQGLQIPPLLSVARYDGPVLIVSTPSGGVDKKIFDQFENMALSVPSEQRNLAKEADRPVQVQDQKLVQIEIMEKPPLRFSYYKASHALIEALTSNGMIDSATEQRLIAELGKSRAR